jgi:hypothetical protein
MRAKEETFMGTRSCGTAIRRLAMAAGFALALSACSVAVEQPPRAMFGDTAWSDGWQLTCGQIDLPDGQPQKVGYEHLYNDCRQYDVAQRLRYQQPLFAEAEERRDRAR